MEMTKQMLPLLVVTLLVGFFPSMARAAEGATCSEAPVQYIADGTLVPGALARLNRNDNSITVNVQTSGLRPGAYTLWWFVYNNRQFCVTTPCADDLFFNIFDVPAVQASILHASGKMVGRSGVGNFSASLSVGGPTGEILFGPGLLNSRSAEIFLVLRYHGPVQPGSVPDQLSTFLGGGCGFDEDDIPTGPCEDVQFVSFP
jgi:hypothetical protein